MEQTESIRKYYGVHSDEVWDHVKLLFGYSGGLMTVEIDDSLQIAQHSETRPALNEGAGGMVGVHGGANAQPYSSNALPA